MPITFLQKIVGLSNPNGTPVIRRGSEIILPDQEDMVTRRGFEITDVDAPIITSMIQSGYFKQKQADWNQEDNVKVDYIKNKPDVLTPDELIDQLEKATDIDIDKLFGF